MRLLLIILLILKSDASIAQKDFMLQGQWRTIAMSQVISPSRDSLYYDLDKDSIYIPAKDFRDAAKDGLDSLHTVNLFKSMYESLKKSTFTFVKDSVILKYKTTKAIGTFQIKNDDILDMHLLFDGKKQEHLIYTFSFVGDLLNILLEADSGYSRFILKKE